MHAKEKNLEHELQRLSSREGKVATSSPCERGNKGQEEKMPCAAQPLMQGGKKQCARVEGEWGKESRKKKGEEGLRKKKINGPQHKGRALGRAKEEELQARGPGPDATITRHEKKNHLAGRS